MTGKTVLERAAVLSGRPLAELPWGEGLQRSALAFVDEIAREVWYGLRDAPYTPPTSLDTPLELPEEAFSALAYGVAMLFARAEGDLTAHTLLSNEYDRHRVPLCRGGGRILDRFGEVTRCAE